MKASDEEKLEMVKDLLIDLEEGGYLGSGGTGYYGQAELIRDIFNDSLDLSGDEISSFFGEDKDKVDTKLLYQLRTPLLEKLSYDYWLKHEEGK
jgi:hypothetical protein